MSEKLLPEPSERIRGARDRRWVALLVLVVAFILAFALRIPLTKANLPVAQHVDERTMLGVLHQLRFGSLHPEFFAYPSLFFYVNHFILSFLPFEEVLQWGRLLNLLFACVLGLGSYLLGHELLGSRLAGIIAALLTLFSPILIRNAGYLNTDLLSSALTVFALVFWGRFFHRFRYRDWGMGVLFAGLALGSKYTAGLVLISYLLLEFVWEPQLTNAVEAHNGLSRLLSRKIPARLFAGLLLLASLAGLAAYLLPESIFDTVLQVGRDINSVVDRSDLSFIAGMRLRMLLLSVTALICAVFCWRWPAVARRVMTLRPYAALAGAALLLLITTPYAFLDWKLFLYDVGFILKSSFAGTGEYWLQYPIWYQQNDSILVLLLAALGAALAVRQSLRPLSLLLLYLLFNIISIGSADVGFVRYLTPILPVLYALAGFGVAAMWARIAQRSRLLAAGLLALLLLVVAYELLPGATPYLGRTPEPNVFYESYQVVTEELKPDRVFFAGYTPSFELQQAGYVVTELPDRALRSGDLLDTLTPGDVLVLNGEANRLLSPDALEKLTLLWVGERFPRQYIYEERPE